MPGVNTQSKAVAVITRPYVSHILCPSLHHSFIVLFNYQIVIDLYTLVSSDNDNNQLLEHMAALLNTCTYIEAKLLLTILE